MSKFHTTLIDNGVTPAELAKAESYQAKYGGELENILVSMGVVSEDRLPHIYATYLGVPMWGLGEVSAWEPSSDVLDFQGLAFLIEKGWIPLECSDDGGWCFLTTSPLDAEARDFLRWRCKRIDVKLTSKAIFDEVLQLQFASEPKAQDFSADISSSEEQRLRDIASEAPTINLLNALITRALDERASDIHIEPTDTGAATRFRLDGVLQERGSIANNLCLPLVSRIKILAGMDISERRRPQDGKFEVKIAGVELDIRASILPLDDGESAVLRLLRKDSLGGDLGGFETLQDVAAAIEHDLQKTSGVILMTGPTGSGKTTTLYSFLNKINDTGIKIITLEDPVEYRLDGVNQVQVNSDIGFDFKAGLRSVVRQDPDVIMVGEVRDAETAQIALQSALTGHLVFSTLHTNDAPSAFTRLLDLGVPEYLLNAALVSVLAQRLVRKVCTACAIPRELTADMEVQYQLSDLATRFNIGDVNLVEAHGCHQCSGSGFKGRIPIIEYLQVDDDIRLLSKNDQFLSQARLHNKAKGFRTLREDGLVRAIRGETTIEEVLRVCG